MTTTTKLAAMCAAMLLAVLGVSCSDDEGEADPAGAHVGSEVDATGPQAGALICIRDASAFPFHLAANRVYQVGERPRDTAAVDQPQVWLDLGPESTRADVAVSVRADYLSDIADEVSDQQFAPGDSC